MRGPTASRWPGRAFSPWAWGLGLLAGVACLALVAALAQPGPPSVSEIAATGPGTTHDDPAPPRTATPKPTATAADVSPPTTAPLTPEGIDAAGEDDIVFEDPLTLENTLIGPDPDAPFPDHPDGVSPTATVPSPADVPARAPAWPNMGGLTKAGVDHVDLHDAPGGPVVRTLPNPYGPMRSVLTFGVVAKRGPWLHVDLPSRPNGSRAWIRADAVTMVPSDVNVDVDLGTKQMVVHQRDQVVLRTEVTTGTGETPTPPGNYYVTQLWPNPGGAYGSYAFGLSGHSDVLTSFNGGDGQIAIHGTDRPDLMGTASSHGCVRVTNEIADQLVQWITVGARVRIRG